MPSIFPFVEKEGKFFAPIVYVAPRFIVQNGSIVEDMANPKIEAGTKGVFAKVRMAWGRTTDSDGNIVDIPVAERTEAELFAVNTEWFASSN